MRGYALTRSWAITTIIFTLSLIPLVINLVCLYHPLSQSRDDDITSNFKIQYGLGVRGVLDSIMGCGEDIKFTPTEAIMSVVSCSESRNPSLNPSRCAHSMPIVHDQYYLANSGCAVPIASRAGLIIADFLLVVVTWLTLAAGPLRPRFRVRSSRSLTDIMLWNGSYVHSTA